MPEKRIKAHVRRRFSEAAEGYERWATVQRHAARYLLSLLPERVFRRVLDIGCGTGFLVEELLGKDRALGITGIDFAPGMVEHCRRRWPEQRFLCADAESFDPHSCFDLILSSFSFQWLERIPKAMDRYFSCLEEGGILALALPVAGSLGELKTAAMAANGKPLHLLDFPEPAVLDGAFGLLEGCRFRREIRELTAWFGTPLEGIRSLKGIGASYDGEEAYTVPEMRRLLAEYGKNYAIAGRGCPVSYRVWFGVAQKESIVCR